MNTISILLSVVAAVLLLQIVVEKYKDKKVNTENEALNKALEEQLENDNSDGRRCYFCIIRAANKRGVSTQTMISIMQEASVEMKEKGGQNDGV